MSSAVIIRAHLPGGLERLRRRSVPNAADGVPAHLTMLYPFVAWDQLSTDVRRDLAAVAERHAAFSYRMTGPHRWPDAIYAGIELVEPFVRLQANLAAAFPALPIYGSGWGLTFVPHVTVAEGAAVADARTIADPAWAALPLDGFASRLEVIATDGVRWKTVWRLPLGRRAERAPR
ncbi:MAG: 2'-5' RNA ligase family protein [Chloroflexota bacterium]|nr:2'-5' RNA ligase family protein [Chloroflexota bacterium]